MKWHNALDDVFGSKLKVRLLRILSKNTGVFTGRELARLVSYSHTQTNSALAELEMSGLILKRHVGNSNTYSLNRDNLLVSKIIIPAFGIEGRIIQDLANRFYERIGKNLLSIILFGSVARKEEGSGSDIDLILVVKDGSDMDKLDEEVSKISLEAAASFGGPASPILLTESEYANKNRSKNAFWRAALKEGIELIPKQLEEVKIG